MYKLIDIPVHKCNSILHIGSSHKNINPNLSPISSLYSGGHLNPAVTAGVLVAGGINVVAAIVYFFAQLVGGIAGAACVLVSFLHTTVE